MCRGKPSVIYAPHARNIAPSARAATTPITPATATAPQVPNFGLNQKYTPKVTRPPTKPNNLTIMTAAMVGQIQSQEVFFLGSMTAGALNSSLLIVPFKVWLSNNDASLQSVVCGHSTLVAVYVGQGNQSLLLAQRYVILSDSHRFRWVDCRGAPIAND